MIKHIIVTMVTLISNIKEIHSTHISNYYSITVSKELRHQKGNLTLQTDLMPE